MSGDVYVHVRDAAIDHTECLGSGVFVDRDAIVPIGVEVIAATRVVIDGVTVWPAPAVVTPTELGTYLAGEVDGHVDELADYLLARFDIRPKPEGETP